ncbi:synaptotagmin-2 [Nasonia vitripennis]|uniref:C2 domain-containing protein n=1 Tax=Nasonia vitripennis TaxID=7425 RepID=A0A7M7Q4I9_NASVI|nr:synaptotagmin-2 [Nasonia vitripennis]
MVIEDLFGPVGQIIIYSVIAVVLIIAILVIACFVTPGCIGYECVRPRKKVEKPVSLKYNGKTKENLSLNDVSYRSWRLGSLYDTENGTICENSTSPRNSIISENSRLETIDTSSVVNLVQPPKQKNGTKEKHFPTELTLSLRYLPHCEGITAAKLVIGIEALSGLPPKQYNCTLEPYVFLEVIKQSWTHRKKQKLYSFKTKGVRHTASPVFRESFVITGVNPQEIKDWILNIEAHDHDRYANHTKLCELQVPLRDAKRIFLSPETHLFNFQMKPSKQEYGNILLGISYLPTAQRLTINVMKLRNIKFMPAVPSVNEFNPYVRILMLNGKTGRRIKKKKTKVIPANPEPEFNETLTFDLPATQMDTLQFLIILCSKITQVDNNVPMMNEIPSDSEDSVSSFQRPKDLCIGKIALGKGVRDMTERLHWFSVLQNPRKLVTVWHTLK